MTALFNKFGLVTLVAGFVLFGGISDVHAQALNPFGSPFAALVIPQGTTRVEIGAVSAVTDETDKTENDFALRVTRKVGKMAAISASAWANPRPGDDSATFQVGATGAISQRASVWVNFGGSPTSEHVPNSQYDFGGSFALDQQLIFIGAASIRNYQGGPSVRLLAPGMAWIINPKVILAATAVNSTVSRLAPGVTAGSNLAFFNVLLNPNPRITLNLGTGYGESDFLAAATPTQSFAQNSASANFNAAATLRFTAQRGVLVSYWLDNGNGAYKTNTFQASLFFEF
jgi:YaiO family outer membrane protein